MRNELNHNIAIAKPFVRLVRGSEVWKAFFNNTSLNEGVGVWESRLARSMVLHTDSLEVRMSEVPARIFLDAQVVDFHQHGLLRNEITVDQAALMVHALFFLGYTATSLQDLLRVHEQGKIVGQFTNPKLDYVRPDRLKELWPNSLGASILFGKIEQGYYLREHLKPVTVVGNAIREPIETLDMRGI